MIDVQNLTKFYGSTVSLDGLSFQVPEGEVLGLLGPNGAGKTTTMRILTGLTRPNDGSARVAGHDVVTQHREVRRILGYLPEEAPVYPEMRVEEYLKLMAGLKDVAARQLAGEVDRVLEETSLEGVRRRLIGNLSKGNRQRVGLAQALIGNPALLILDEPTVGLDPKQITEVCDLIRRMKGARTVILSTHILSNVSMACTSVVIIKEGRLVAEGPVDKIGEREGSRRLKVRVAGGTEERVRAVVREAGRFADTAISLTRAGEELALSITAPDEETDRRAAIARAVVEAGWELLELAESRPTLEDVFLRATAGQWERPS